MANNCLVTKLNGTVDNDNIPILNTIRLKSNADHVYTLGVTGVSGVVVSSTEPFTVSEEGITVSTYTFSAETGRTFQISAVNQVIKISDKYLVKAMTINPGGTAIDVTADSSDFYCLPAMTSFRARRIKFSGDFNPKYLTSLSDIMLYQNDMGSLSLDKLNGLPLTTLLISTNLTGTLADIANMTTLNSLDIAFNGSNISGNISALANIIGLTYLSVTQLSLVTGSIKDFIVSQLGAGRTSGELNILCSSSGIAGQFPSNNIMVVYSGITATVMDSSKTTTYSTYNGSEWIDN